MNRITLLSAIVSLLAPFAAQAQTGTRLAWEEVPVAGVSGFAVTIDGVRTDYGMAPLGSSGACSCSITVPFSGGRHTIVVSAYNSSGETASVPITIAPSAAAGGPYVGQGGTPLAVNGSGSTAPTGSFVRYAWRWGDGTSDTSAATPTASHVYTSAGTFTITLTVTDNAGATSQSSTTATIAASSNSPPTVSLTSPANGSTVVEPAAIPIAATASDSDGIRSVDFFAGSNRLGTATSSPYSMTWSNVPAGNYVLTAVATDRLGATSTSPPVAVPVNGRASTPFLGTPAAIPGTVEAENFDNGGEGLAYHDTTSGNSGGAYRSTDVDIQPAGPGGYNVGWVAAGEWLNYSVNVARAGAYTITFHVAAPAAGGTFHLEMNGVNVTGPLTVPNTGDWQNYTTVSKTVTIGAGAQVARLVMDTSAGGIVGNFVSIQFVAGGASTPFLGVAAAIPGTIEVENFDNGGEGVAYHDTTSGNAGSAYRSSDVDIQPAGPGGYNVGWVDAGEWLKYSVNVANAGAYTINFQVAAPAGGGTFHLEMNGVNVTGPLTVPDTGDWQTYATVSKTVTLAAGPQLLRLVMDTSAGGIVGNFDAIQFVPAGVSTPFSRTPQVLPGTIEVENFDIGGEGIAYHDTTSGNSGGAYRSDDVDIQPAAPGGYNVGWVAAGEWLKYSVNVTRAGTYAVNFRVAAPSSGGTFHLEMNGVNVTGPLTVSNTGGWQVYTTVSKTVTLGAGLQTARLVMDAPGTDVGNFDWIQFVAVP